MLCCPFRAQILWAYQLPGALSLQDFTPGYNISGFQPWQCEGMLTVQPVFGLKVQYILAQWQRPEGTKPWVNNQSSIRALKGQYKPFKNKKMSKSNR